MAFNFGDDRETFECPERDKPGPIPDFWTEGGVCTYCGSMKYEDFLVKVLDMIPVTLSKVTKAFHFDNGNVFYFSHANMEQQAQIQSLYAEKQIVIKESK